jgi:hypothetical protein
MQRMRCIRNVYGSIIKGLLESQRDSVSKPSNGESSSLPWGAGLRKPTNPKRLRPEHPNGWNVTPYRCFGIIHREQTEPSGICSVQLPVNNSGRAMFGMCISMGLHTLGTGFAARPGRRMSQPKRSTFARRASPPDGGYCPITNAQNFSPASSSAEYYKGLAVSSQAGISPQ